MPTKSPHSPRNTGLLNRSGAGRDQGLDNLKGFLIISVLIGHFNLKEFIWLDQTSNRYFEILNLLFNSLPVYYYHVPLFFCISTFFSRQIGKEWLKTSGAILAGTYAFWFFRPSIFYDPITDLKVIATSFSDWLWGDWHHIRSPLWFLTSLITIQVFVSVWRTYCAKVEGKRPVAFGALFIMLLWGVFMVNIQTVNRLHMSGSFPWGIDIAVILIPYLLVLNILYVKRTKLLMLGPLVSQVIWLTIIAISWAAIHNFEPIKTRSAYHHRIDFAQLSVPETYAGWLGFIGLSAGILFYFLRFVRLRLLSVIGTYSLPIFVLHYYYFQRLSHLFKMSRSQVQLLDSPIASFMATIIIFCMGVCLPILTSKLLILMSPNFRYIGMVDDQRHGAR